MCEDNFNFLTKMCLLQNRELAFEMARTAAEHGIPALINSSDATDHPGEYLQAGFSRVIRGELERRWSKTIQQWPAPVTPQPAIANLDELPPPAWDLLDIEPYRARLERSARLFFDESGGQPRLSLSLQLVREAALWRRLPPLFR